MYQIELMPEGKTYDVADMVLNSRPSQGLAKSSISTMAIKRLSFSSLALRISTSQEIYSGAPH